jgi:hypothetical protein
MWWIVVAHLISILAAALPRMVDLSILPVLLTVRQAVAVSGLSRTYVYERLSDGSLEGRKIGRSTMVLTASLLSLIERLPRFGDAQAPRNNAHRSARSRR